MSPKEFEIRAPDAQFMFNPVKKKQAVRSSVCFLVSVRLCMQSPLSFLCLSVGYMLLSRSISQLISLSVYVFFCLNVCLSVSSVSLNIFLSVSRCLTLCLFVRLFVLPLLAPSVPLSLRLTDF